MLKKYIKIQYFKKKINFEKKIKSQINNKRQKIEKIY